MYVVLKIKIGKRCKTRFIQNMKNWKYVVFKTFEKIKKSFVEVVHL